MKNLKQLMNLSVEVTKKYDDIVAKMTTLEARVEALENAGVSP